MIGRIRTRILDVGIAACGEAVRHAGEKLDVIRRLYLSQYLFGAMARCRWER